VSSQAARSPSALQAVRSAVTERTRRAGGPTRRGPKGPKGKGAYKKGAPASSRIKAGKGLRSPQAAKRASAAAEGGRSPRSSKVVLRRIRPLSVLRVSVLFYVSLSLALFVAAVLLWLGASAVGLIDNLEGFMDEVGFTDFRLRAGPLMVASLAGSVILVVAGSLANLLMAVLYNLIGDVVGGIRIVLSEDTEATGK
jgi:hypothetical protein